MATCIEMLDKPTREALDAGSLSVDQARQIDRQGPEAVVFALLELMAPHQNPWVS